MHDEFALYKVKAIRLCLKWMINHFLHCENKEKRKSLHVK